MGRTCWEPDNLNPSFDARCPLGQLSTQSGKAVFWHKAELHKCRAQPLYKPSYQLILTPDVSSRLLLQSSVSTCGQV